MRKLIIKTSEWIHATLIMAAITPLLYALGAQGPDTIGQSLYYKCLLIVFPVAATDLAVKKCKGLLSYLAISALVSAVTFATGWAVAESLRPSPIFWVYLATLLVETTFVIAVRVSDRLRQKEQDTPWVETDPSLRYSFNSLCIPSFSFLIYFVSVYAIAVNLNNPAVCNIALFSAIVYTLITLLYQHVCETEKYLAINKRTCNIPSKRIYGIGNGMMAIFLLLLIIVILPALFTISNRHYRDIRNSLNSIHIDLMPTEEYGMQEDDPDFMEMLIKQYGEPKPMPEWVNTLLNIMAVMVSLFFVEALIKFIYNTFRTFRGINDENGDIVEELEETIEGVKIRKPYVIRRKLPERERIRKEYRKFIRKHRKERPAHYESPTEIEQNAGIAESEETRKLHEQYELARYGQEI